VFTPKKHTQQTFCKQRRNTIALHESELKKLLWTHRNRPDQSLRHTVSQTDRQTDRQTNTAFHLSQNDPLQTSPTSTSTRVRVHQSQQSMVTPLG